ncbi:MAG TPA: TetR/AcrR family transcriptional regulator [Pseudonocardiaceae bacterium]|jgi:AcrR family transcriptional regulator|nr:TetR/AcrR family transcriptional regulator [Pseudonocardiaceae bacterium]
MVSKVAQPIAQSRTHRTQAERSERTRELLFEATIECLLELGYAGTSVNEICKRAGLSRGAQQHHFATKAELMAHALEYLVGKLTAGVIDSVRGLPDEPDRIDRGIDLLWESFSGTLSTAAMELWVAARTDPELRETLLPVDRALGRATLETYREIAWPDLPEERMETLYWLTVNLTRGLAMDAMIGGDPGRRAKLLAEWKRMANAMVKMAGPAG